MSFFDDLTTQKQILAEASEKGTANDFWIVVDCAKSCNYKDYIHRTNAQGLIDTVTKLGKNKGTRGSLDTFAIFNKDDKTKAEKEAKRRAKIMKNEMESDKREEIVSEDSSCPKCKSKKEKYTRLATKAKHEAKMMAKLRSKDSSKHSGAMSSLGDFNAKLANEPCDDCSSRKVAEALELDSDYLDLFMSEDPLSENYYADHATHKLDKSSAPANVAKVTNSNLAALTDPAKYGVKDDPYTPSEQDAVDNENERTVKVPAEILKMLKDGAAEARKTSENLIVTKTEDKTFYNDLAVVYDDMRAMLEKGTIEGVKEAQVFITTLMGPMLYRIPSEVASFIAHGGEPRTLKSYVNSMTVPKMGYGVNGELDKL